MTSMNVASVLARVNQAAWLVPKGLALFLLKLNEVRTSLLLNVSLPMVGRWTHYLSAKTAGSLWSVGLTEARTYHQTRW